MANQKQLAPDTLLADRYQIVKRVGGGGMGSVYLAYDTKFGITAKTQRAVKEMFDVFSDEVQRKKAIDDFKREGQLLASLEHPSIPTVYDYFINDGKYYLVMKYIPGGDLSNKLKKSASGFIEERSVAEWAIQVCDVLDYIHNQDPPIIYRDLKPANLMIDDTKTPTRIMLVDFGIARFVAPTQKGVTAIGTMGYAPPELFSGKVEPRSDLYSLGATIFHLCTGADPQDNPLLIFDFTKNPRPRQINPALTPEMDAIIARSVEHKPEKRFASAADMKKALQEHIHNLDNPPMSIPGIPAGGKDVVFCGSCGGQIATDDSFCPHCGAAQPSAGRNSRQVAKLAILDTNGMQAVSLVLEKDTNLLGRNDPHTGVFPEVDLTMHDPETKVSRRHARIFREGSRFLVEDLSSVNGTYVNGSIKLFPKQPHPLQDGDELKLGETRIRFSMG